MTDRHSHNEDNRVDELLSGADEDLRTSLDAALDVDSGLAAVLTTVTPVPPSRIRFIDVRAQLETAPVVSSLETTVANAKISLRSVRRWPLGGNVDRQR